MQWLRGGAAGNDTTVGKKRPEVDHATSGRALCSAAGAEKGVRIAS